MEARLSAPQTLRKILDALKELVDEANIECNESGLSLQAMDSSHCALVSMNLNSKSFDKFKCDDNETLGVNLLSIQKILKCGDSQDTLTLSTNADHTQLKFQFENGGRFSEFSLSLMDIDTDKLSIPEAEPEVRITLGSSDFNKICHDLTQFGDTVKIMVKSKTIVFSATGQLGNGSITLSSYDSVEDRPVEIEMDNSIDKLELSFALKYLNYFTKASPLSDKVVLELSTGRPLIVLYQLDDDTGYIKYYLAPKVEDDDEDEENE
ncbi:proliferating cell nuclear antigen [Histomonas meleagridis]|uniref:proliferating cell nuclear antigen n=1 Tax=Histomonas meleagridis TaxID=135588 RepID=UPI003559A291|nr:proliferating cell nuclear antigen [Histomonas meleagridis]KAH0803425.1 proliferating cell nuclear antigen [Histomonas meleagridis]